MVDFGSADDQPGQEDVHDRPDGEDEQDRPGAEVAAQKEPDDHDRQLDHRANPANRQAGQTHHPRHQPVARTWSEPGADSKDSRAFE